MSEIVSLKQYCEERIKLHRQVTNEVLIDRQNLSEDEVNDINCLHMLRDTLTILMYKSVNKDNWKFYNTLLDNVEEQLQNNWKFPVDSNYYRFWDRPHCTCPKMDNDDAYPYGRYIVSGDCPIHGEV